MVFSVKHKIEENRNSRYQVIETGHDLEAFAARLKKQKRIAVDLEADSMHHFQEKVCLIQIASDDETVVIDPLKIRNLSILQPIFAKRRVQKILHGSDYDIRSLYRDFKIEVGNLFDTQIATRFLGYRETGLDAVLKRHFDISLDKKYQKKDWSKRPLPREMLDYAAGDAAYLIPLAKTLEAELKKMKRLPWVREECDLLRMVRPEMNNGKPLFVSFKGAGLLQPRNLAILESLLHLRKDIACRKDRPYYKIIGNNSLLALAKAGPSDMERLAKIGALSAKQTRMYGKELVAEIKKALKLPEGELPVYPRKKTPRTSGKAAVRVKELKEWRNGKSDALDIDPAIVLNKTQITSIARNNPKTVRELKKVEECKKWQIKAFGKEIIAILKNCI